MTTKITKTQFINRLKTMNEAEILYNMYKATGVLMDSEKSGKSYTGEPINIVTKDNTVTVTYQSGATTTWTDDGLPPKTDMVDIEIVDTPESYDPNNNIPATKL